MPCIEGKLPVLPVLPSPFSLAPPPIVFPVPSAGVNVCCIKANYSPAPIPIPLSLLPSATVIALVAAIAAEEEIADAYLDQFVVLSIPCPRE